MMTRTRKPRIFLEGSSLFVPGQSGKDIGQYVDGIEVSVLNPSFCHERPFKHNAQSEWQVFDTSLWAY